MSVTVVDGGFSTQLSYYVGDVIDGDPLWSARFLATDPKAVYRVHLDYLKVGAEVLITNSYQASIGGFNEHLGLNDKASFQLIKESVFLAQRARTDFLSGNPSATKPLIAGSVGSYGASLHDGSEYTGCFAHKMKAEALRHWHRPRIQALIEAGVDLLAIETIPVLAEAIVLLELLKNEFPDTKAWLSFQCKDGLHTAHGEKFSDAVATCWQINSKQLLAIGCNCLDPHHVTSLIKSANHHVDQSIPYVVYPNSGEHYSPSTGWTGKSEKPDLSEFVEEWLDLGVKFVGGCCRTDANDVTAIRKVVKNWMLKSRTVLTMNERVYLLDGSQSMQLEKYVNQTTSHPLWVCRYLYEEPNIVKTMHKDYIEAGSDIVATLTYQVSVENLMSSYDISVEKAIEVIQSSVEVAKTAWQEFDKETGSKRQHIIAGSVGPYGAFLLDGSEYTGEYINHTSFDNLIAFHRQRVKALVDAGVDFLSFETLPSVIEGLALLKLLREFPNVKAWVSFTCKEGRVTARGEDFGASVAECWREGRNQLIGVGCNCTHPDLVQGLLDSANQAIREPVPFVTYSNSGEVYDGKCWTGEKKNLSALLPQWLSAGVKYVGGCCRTDATDIRNIRLFLDQIK